MSREPKIPPSQQPDPEPKPVLYVDLDWDTREYYLFDQATRQKVAGPFPTSWAALEFAATGLCGGRGKVVD